MADEFDILVELAETLYPGDEDMAKRFAIGRHGTERQARRAGELGDPAIERAAAAVAASARNGLGLTEVEAEIHASETAARWLAASPAPDGQRVTQFARRRYAKSLTTKGR